VRRPPLALLLGLGLALSGCSTLRDLLARGPEVAAPAGEAAPRVAAAAAGAPVPGPRPAEASPAAELRRAERLVREGHALTARDIYQQVIDRHPGHPARPRALWLLARLLADPASPARDHRLSVAVLDRLLLEHPGTEWEPDARAWRGVLAELVAREDEHQRQRAQSTEEIARLRAQLQRLKRIDVELDRRR
jgi:hypothetical protein